LVRAYRVEPERSSALLIYERDDGSFGTFVAPGLAAAQRDYEQNGWWRHDLRFIRSVERGYLANLDTAMVRDLLGLTLGEARVATLVGSGLAPRESAQKLGIAEESARTTLKRVFDKVGISRQSELVGLLTRLVLR